MFIEIAAHGKGRCSSMDIMKMWKQKGLLTYKYCTINIS